MEEINKIPIVIGVEFELTKEEQNFFGERFEVSTVLFSDLLKGKGKKTPHFLYFSGGEDVEPSFYGENKGMYTLSNIERDSLASSIIGSYGHLPKLGICRGAQLLTVFAGGKLIQHVSGHATGKLHKIDMQFTNHNNITTYDITSTHHQMMYPFNMVNTKYQLLAWSSKYLGNIYLNGDNKQIELPEKFVEPEIVYYPGAYSLAIQGHPEFKECPKNTKLLCLKLIEQYLLNY